MLLPLFYALAAPPLFEKVVTARAAELKAEVVDWWSDDLDGDGKPENIAFVCNADAGHYLVERKGVLAEIPRIVDGRNPCVKPEHVPWHEEQLGAIQVDVEYAHGHELERYAFRGDQLVVTYDLAEELVVRSDSEFDSETRVIDWDSLEYHEVDATSRGSAKVDERVIPLVFAPVGRPVQLAEGVSMSATQRGPDTVLHVAAAARLQLAFCPAGECKKPFKVTPKAGVADVPVTEPLGQVVGQPELELEVIVGKQKLRAQLRSTGPTGYPTD